MATTSKFEKLPFTEAFKKKLYNIRYRQKHAGLAWRWRREEVEEEKIFKRQNNYSFHLRPIFSWTLAKQAQQQLAGRVGIPPPLGRGGNWERREEVDWKAAYNEDFCHDFYYLFEYESSSPSRTSTAAAATEKKSSLSAQRCVVKIYRVSLSEMWSIHFGKKKRTCCPARKERTPTLTAGER